MFNGYYLKINNEIYPTKFMVIPTYKPDDKPIVIKSYYDAAYGKHLFLAPKSDLTISFDIRSMYSYEFPEAIQPFNGLMEIEYFDSKIDDYKTDLFRCTSDLNPDIVRQYNDKVLLAQLSITLERVAE